MSVRCFTGLFGGYAAAAGSASLFARILPISRGEATAWGMIMSFLLFAVFGLWTFYETRLLRVAVAIWGIAFLTAGTVFVLGNRG